MDYTPNFWDYFLLFLIILGILYKYLSWNVNALQRKKLKALPTYPIVGNVGETVLKKMHLRDILKQAYLAFPEEKYIAFYQFQSPFILLRDIETIKQITIKDFDHFQDHSNSLDDDSFFSKNLLNLSGKKWHAMRTTLSPVFTSSKIKNMFVLMSECGELMTKFYLEKIKELPNKNLGYIEVDMKDAYTRHTNDIIASCAFGIKINSFTDDKNTFYTLGKEITTFTAFQMLKIMILAAFPKLAKIVKPNLFSPKATNFFRNLVIDQMDQRRNNNIIRQDMIHLLMEAKKGSLHHEISNETSTEFSSVEESNIGKSNIKIHWTDDDLIAQVTLFFFAGFETSSTVLCFMSHELALNPEIQKKLQNEIDDALIENNGNVSYNVIQGMKYMDMVVSETLRKWPPAILTDRKCVKPYSLPATKSNGKPHNLKVDDAVWIPIAAIHHDPNYYSNPEVFDPERFSNENKDNITPFSYMPFGVGPRNCIASRFALMEVKSIIFHLLAKFDFVQTSKTLCPLVLDKTTFTLIPKGGFQIGLKPRSQYF